mgnify:CR=1 FL=1
MNLKSLAKDTAIYGLSSIVGRFLNYLLVPLYTFKIAAESGGYGIVTNLYAYTALLLVVLTFGMETTLFRFSNKDGVEPDKVYGTILKMVASVACAFVVIVLVALRPIAGAMGYATHPEYVGCMALTVAFDAIQAIMFSRLRQQHKPVKFMALKFAFIIPNIILNLIIFILLPRIPSLTGLYERFDGGVGLIFFINLICTSMVFVGFTEELKGLGYGFDRSLAKTMLRYSWPLLILGLVGVLNQVADKILFTYLMPGHEGKVQLGIYGACVKIAMIMSILTQAFRYAYEPIVFNGNRDRNNPRTLADGMKYFIIFTLLAYMAVIFYMPLLKRILIPNQAYWVGLDVVPIVMMAEIFMGIYFNLSFWYKMTDQTWWGAIISTIGAIVMIAVNVIFVPKVGYWACAWGGFAGYGVSMLTSWFIGQKKYPIPYDLHSIMRFFSLAISLLCISKFCFSVFPTILKISLDTLILMIYMFVIWKNLKLKKEI